MSSVVTGVSFNDIPIMKTENSGKSLPSLPLFTASSWLVIENKSNRSFVYQTRQKQQAITLMQGYSEILLSYSKVHYLKKEVIVLTMNIFEDA